MARLPYGDFQVAAAHIQHGRPTGVGHGGDGGYRGIVHHAPFEPSAELGIEPMGKRGFLLADSWRIEMDYGEARARDALLPRLLSGQVTVGRGS